MYAADSSTSLNVVLKVVARSGQLNYYSKDCTGVGFPYKGNRHPGLCCPHCHLVWKTCGENLRKRAERRGSLFEGVVHSLQLPVLTDDDRQVLVNFTHTKDRDLNGTGILLRNRARSVLNFYNTAKASGITRLFVFSFQNNQPVLRLDI